MNRPKPSKKSNIRQEAPIVIMVDWDKVLESLGSIILSSFTALIIYFGVINLIILIQNGGAIPASPIQWLVNPLLNLYILNPFAIAILIISEFIGVSLFVAGKKKH